MKNKDEIIIYKNSNNEIEIEVKIEKETVWLNQAQIVKLFQRDQSVISRHINNVFKEGELDKKSNMHLLHIANSDKPVTYFSLDVIISVGYRVKSKHGTRFRVWANKILKEYLLKGYTINTKHLNEKAGQLKELKKTIELLDNVVKNKLLDSKEATGLLNVISDYSYALDTLDKYDHQTLKKPSVISKDKFKITYKTAIDSIKTLKKKFGGTALFGNEKDNSFKSSLENIYVTFQKNELYPGAENKAAHLLYFVVKNHSFSDGNKRIAAFLFIWYLDQNGLLYSKEGFKKIEDNTLVALTLMIAESKSKDKDMMIKVILNLMQKKN